MEGTLANTREGGGAHRIEVVAVQEDGLGSLTNHVVGPSSPPGTREHKKESEPRHQRPAGKWSGWRWRGSDRLNNEAVQAEFA